MAIGIAEIILLGLLADWAARKARLPGLIGLLLLGVCLGPYALGTLNQETQDVAADLRLIALIVILLRAGLEISKEALARSGVRAILMAFVPCLCEVLAVTLAGPLLLPLTRMEAAILGSILAAVSPAVVVPLMIRCIEEGRGAERAVPTMILAGASCDDAVAIVLAMSLLGIHLGEQVNIVRQALSIPFSVISGGIIGLLLGVLLYRLFDRFNPRATKRVLILLGLSVVLLHVQHRVEAWFPFAALISIMAIGFIILEKREHAAHEISAKLGKVWVFAQLLLFTLVGAQVNIPVAIGAGLGGGAVILAGLAGRSIGVQLCLAGSRLTRRERIFAGLSYLPKATVQAAIGATPLIAMQSAGRPAGPGEIILAVAVLSIVLTAPLGAILISWAGRNLLTISAGTPAESPAMQAAIESQAEGSG